MKQKSLNLNMLLNAIRNVMSVIFPLITFPYISRILGVENLGKYNFAASIESYVVLIAGLGINLYAVREGARIRNNKEKFGEFADQIFTINVLSTIFSYFFLVVLILLVPTLKTYTILILILSVKVGFVTIGTEWMYSIYEDYAYITIRSIIVQMLSLVLMFVFVKTVDDVNIYAIISVIASSGSSLFNYIHAKKYHRVRITKRPKLKTHLKPILVLFGMTATISIYTSSDITILGFICGDESVGVYTVATKIYTVIKSIVSSIIVVSIPRISSYIGRLTKGDLLMETKKVYDMLITCTMPAIFGVAILSNELVLIISDISFISAVVPTVVLSIAIFFSLGAYFWGQAILVPFKKEKFVLKVTIVSAITNIVLNLVLIPFFNVSAAAFTTLISEIVAFIWCMIEGRKLIGNITGLKTILKTIVGCIPIIVYSVLLKTEITNMYIYMVVLVVLSGATYLIIELLLKNNVLYDILGKIINKLKGCKGG